jgi:hypothetical protein
MPKVNLKQLDGCYAIVQLPADAPTPSWWDGPGFCSISRGDDEVSIVCLEDRVPAGVTVDRDWTAFKFLGPFAFGETGIVLSVLRPLSENGIGIFVISTYDGDHLLLKQDDAAAGKRYLQAAGHRIV